MAATALTVTDLGSVGAESSVDLTTYFTPDTTNGNSCSNTSGLTRLLVHNSAGTADTLSVTRVEVVDGYTLPAHDFTVPANATTLIGPFPVDVFGGTLTFKVTAATSTIIPVSLA